MRSEVSADTMGRSSQLRLDAGSFPRWGKNLLYENVYRQQAKDKAVSLQLLSDTVAAVVKGCAPWLSHFGLDPSSVGDSVASVGKGSHSQQQNQNLVMRPFDRYKGCMVVVIATVVRDNSRWHNPLFKSETRHDAVHVQLAVLTAENDVAFRQLEEADRLASDEIFPRLQQAHEEVEEENSAILVLGAAGDGKSTLINSLLDEDEDACEAGKAAGGVTKLPKKCHWKNVPEPLRSRCGPGRKWLLIDAPGFGDTDVDDDFIYGMLEQDLCKIKVFAVIATFYLLKNRIDGNAMRAVQKLITKGFVFGQQGGQWMRVFLVGTHGDKADKDQTDFFYKEVVPTFFRSAPNNIGPALIATDFKDGRVMCKGLVDRLAALDAATMRLQFECLSDMAPDAQLEAKQRRLAAATHCVRGATLKDMALIERLMPSVKKDQFEKEFQPCLFNFLHVHNKEVRQQDTLYHREREPLLVVIWRWRESPGRARGRGVKEGLFQTWRERTLMEKSRKLSRGFTKLQSLWLPDDDTTVELTSNSAEGHRVILDHKNGQLVTSLCFGEDSSAAAQWFECLESCKLRKVGLLQSRSAAVAPPVETSQPLDKSTTKSCCSLL